MIFASWIAVILFFQLAVIVGRKTGLTILPQEEIPFYPLRFNISQNEFRLVMDILLEFKSLSALAWEGLTSNNSAVILDIILFSSTRISTISNFIVPRGFSFHTGFIIWCICSGFLLEFFESLLLSGQMKPKYDDFVKTRMDLINRNMTLGEILMLSM